MDSITVLRTRTQRLAKLLRDDGTSEGYDKAKTLDGYTMPLDGLASIHALLERLIPRPECCVVRGELIDGPMVKGVRRKLHMDRKTGELPTIRDVPRRWLALDLEGVGRPEGVPAANLLACAELALAEFPSSVRGAACIIQASASHGVKLDIRLRAWFWLDRPLAGIEAKRWLKDLPCDRSVFGAVQPIYTAAPVLAAGVSDPIPCRIALRGGETTVATPSPAELAPPQRPAAKPVREALPTAEQATRYIRTALERAAAGIASAGEGNRHPLMVAESCRLARFVKAGLLASNVMADVIRAAARSAGKDDDVEIDAAIEYGLANPWDAGAMPGVGRHG